MSENTLSCPYSHFLSDITFGTTIASATGRPKVCLFGSEESMTCWLLPSMKTPPLNQFVLLKRQRLQRTTVPLVSYLTWIYFSAKNSARPLQMWLSALTHAGALTGVVSISCQAAGANCRGRCPCFDTPVKGEEMGVLTRC